MVTAAGCWRMTGTDDGLSLASPGPDRDPRSVTAPRDAGGPRRRVRRARAPGPGRGSRGCSPDPTGRALRGAGRGYTRCGTVYASQAHAVARTSGRVSHTA